LEGTRYGAIGASQAKLEGELETVKGELAAIKTAMGL
jgi:hypothetical protein